MSFAFETAHLYAEFFWHFVTFLPLIKPHKEILSKGEISIILSELEEAKTWSELGQNRPVVRAVRGQIPKKKMFDCNLQEKSNLIIN